MNYAIETLKTRKKQVWESIKKHKKELIKYNKKTIYYRICKRKIESKLRDYNTLDKSINVLINTDLE